MLKKAKEAAALEDITSCLHDNFWVAYDALDSNKKNLLELGIELSKDI